MNYHCNICSKNINHNKIYEITIVNVIIYKSSKFLKIPQTILKFPHLYSKLPQINK